MNYHSYDKYLFYYNIHFDTCEFVILMEYTQKHYSNYLIKDFDVELSTLSYQKEEVEKLMWADKETVLKFIENNEFIPYEKEFISVFQQQLSYRIIDLILSQ